MTLQKHSVPASNAGFNYQFERAILWLAKSVAGTKIGIETLDDVTVIGKDGELVLEQDKLTFQDSTEVFGDRSRNLWNTLATWLTAAQTGELDLAKTQLLLVSNFPSKSPLVLEISRADNLEKAELCITALSTASKNPSETIKPFVQAVIDASDKAVLAQMILKIQLVDQNEADRDSIYTAIADALQIPSWALPYKQEIVHELLGWTHRQILDLWQNHEPGWIHRDNFVNQFHAIIERIQRNMRRERIARLIPLQPDKINSQQGARYVQQIYLVSDDDDLVDDAIKDYLRSNIEKIRISREGDVTDEDWIDFEDHLKERWQTIRRRVLRMEQTRSEQEQGFMIFDSTTDHKEDLAGIPTSEAYLTKGAFHRLADTLTIGWHPDYKNRLK